MVAIDDRNQVVELVLRCRHRRLPDRTLLDLSITEDHEDAVLLVIHLASDGHPCAHREAVPQRPGGRFHPGNLDRRVGAEDSSGLFVRLEIFDREISLRRQHVIENNPHVPLAQDGKIPFSPIRVLWPNSHNLPVERRQDVRQR